MSGAPTEQEVRDLKAAAFMRAWNDKEWAAWHALADSWLAQREVIAAAQEVLLLIDSLPDESMKGCGHFASLKRTFQVGMLELAVAAVVSGTPE